MDLRFALRSLRKSPGFTFLAVVVLALGIGANAAIFSVANAVLLRPLSYKDPGRLATLRSFHKKEGNTFNVSDPDFRDWRDQNHVFEAMASYAGDRETVLAGAEPEQASAVVVTQGFFRVMGVEPALGRLFLPEEERKGGDRATLISYAFWQRNFHGDPKALGRKVKMLDMVFTIVGVLPPGFRFPDEADLWASFDAILEPEASRSAHNYSVVARLKPGVTLEQARAEMSAIAGRIERQYPDTNLNKGVAVIPMLDWMVHGVRSTLYLLLGAVALVLLIACANVANLLLAKATARTREIAIRAAVGASRARIMRQLITESVLLSVIAGGAGLLLAVWGNAALVALAPSNVPRLAEAGLDSGVLLFTLAVSLASSLLFGLAPALHASKADLNNALKQGGTRAVLAGGTGGVRSALVVGEVALSMVLLTGAGLAIKSFLALQNVSPGFNPAGLMTMESAVPTSSLEGARRAVAFYDEMLRRGSSIPGVLSLAAVSNLPTKSGHNGLYQIEGRPPLPPADYGRQWAGWRLISPGYFRTMEIPLKAGRDFNQQDRASARFAAIISQGLARQSFPNEDPIGKRLKCGLDSDEWMTIVGIAADVHQDGLENAPVPELYMPHVQHPFPSTALTLVVRSSGDPAALAQAIRRNVRELNPEVPVQFSTMETTLAQSVAPPRFRTLLLGIFAGLAVCLAMAGVYGVMSYVVSQRSPEIGVRMALGARSNDVLRLVLAQGLKLAAMGLAIGLAAALFLTRLLQSLLYEVQATDPATYMAVSCLLAAAAMLSCYLPARRATQVDPLVALRQE